MTSHAPPPAAPLFHEADLKAPAPWLMPKQGRTPREGAPSRSLLEFLGDRSYPWKMHINFGPCHGVLEACRQLLRRAADRHGAIVSRVGWSPGGLHAREMAKKTPDLARCVITPGTPSSGLPRATNAWRFYQRVSGQYVHDPVLIEQIRGTPPVPTASIFSKTDGVVAWQCSIVEKAPQAGNIEVDPSHIGMDMNPLALYAVADRLPQGPAHWRPFDARGARRWFYKATGRGPLAATGY